MSTDNITTFFSKVESDPSLVKKINLATAEAFASVAREEGQPFTAEEFLAFQKAELSDEALEQVAGGFNLGEALSQIFKSREKGDYSGMRMPLIGD